MDCKKEVKYAPSVKVYMQKRTVKEEKFNAISVPIVDIIFHPLDDQKGS